MSKKLQKFPGNLNEPEIFCAVYAGPDAYIDAYIDDPTVPCRMVGRGPNCEIRIDHPTVSRIHCEIRRITVHLYAIRDLGSSNGTYIDGRKIGRDWTSLFPKSVLRLGSYECSFEGYLIGLPTLKFD